MKKKEQKALVIREQQVAKTPRLKRTVDTDGYTADILDRK